MQGKSSDWSRSSSQSYCLEGYLAIFVFWTMFVSSSVSRHDYGVILSLSCSNMVTEWLCLVLVTSQFLTSTKQLGKATRLSLGEASVGTEVSSHTVQPGCAGKKCPLPLGSSPDTEGLHHLDPRNVGRQPLSYYWWMVTRTFSCVILLSRIPFSKFELTNRCSHEGSECISILFQPEQITADHLFFVSGWEMPEHPEWTHDF